MKGRKTETETETDPKTETIPIPIGLLADAVAARLLDRGLDTKIEKLLARRGLWIEFLSPTGDDE